MLNKKQKVFVKKLLEERELSLKIYASYTRYDQTPNETFDTFIKLWEAGKPFLMYGKIENPYEGCWWEWNVWLICPKGKTSLMAEAVAEYSHNYPELWNRKKKTAELMQYARYVLPLYCSGDDAIDLCRMAEMDEKGYREFQRNGRDESLAVKDKDAFYALFMWLVCTDRGRAWDKNAKPAHGIHSVEFCALESTDYNKTIHENYWVPAVEHCRRWFGLAMAWSCHYCGKVYCDLETSVAYTGYHGNGGIGVVMCGPACERCQEQGRCEACDDVGEEPFDIMIYRHGHTFCEGHEEQALMDWTFDVSPNAAKRLQELDEKFNSMEVSIWIEPYVISPVFPKEQEHGKAGVVKYRCILATDGKKIPGLVPKHADDVDNFNGNFMCSEPLMLVKQRVDDDHWKWDTQAPGLQVSLFGLLRRIEKQGQVNGQEQSHE